MKLFENISYLGAIDMQHLTVSVRLASGLHSGGNNVLEQGLQNFSIKGQVVNMLNFVEHWLYHTALTCIYGLKATTGIMPVIRYVCLSFKLHLQSNVVG